MADGKITIKNALIELDAAVHRALVAYDKRFEDEDEMEQGEGSYLVLEAVRRVFIEKLADIEGVKRSEIYEDLLYRNLYEE